MSHPSFATSPDNPVVGDSIAIRVTYDVNGFSSDAPTSDASLTSAPPGSTIPTGRSIGAVFGAGFPVGTVLASTSNTRKSVLTNLSETDGTWDGAEITFKTGPNTGRAAKIASFASDVATLTADLPELPVAGDRFSLAAADTEKRALLVPDQPGAYALSVAYYRDIEAPPAHDGDGSGTRRLLVGNSTMTIHVAAVAELPIRTLAGGGLTLRIKATNATVVAAELVDPLSSEDFLAIRDATVITKLAALVGVAVTSLGPDLTTTVATMVAEYNDHRVLTAGSVHASADTINVYVPDRPYDQRNSVEQLNGLRAELVGHLTGASAAAARWHTADDTKNTPIVGPAATLAEAQVLYADLWRCYERHRVQLASPASHGGSGDTTNVLGTVDKQSDLIIAYLDFIAAAQPTVPAGASSGELRLQTLYGYKVAA